MKHPSPEEWMSLLYGESTAAQKTTLTAHLDACAECAKKWDEWRGGMKALDTWSEPVRRRPRMARPVLPWAAAAALVLGLGMAIGRFTSVDAGELRASLQHELDAKLNRALQQQQAILVQNIRAAGRSAGAETQRALTDLARALEEKHVADNETVLLALREVDARRATDFGKLRKDLDTVAVFADARLNSTQEQLLELATITNPAESK